MLQYYTLGKYWQVLDYSFKNITPPLYDSRYIIMTMIMIISSSDRCRWCNSNRWICMVLDVSLTEALAALVLLLLLSWQS